MKLWNLILIILWVLGMIAIFIAPQIVMMFWAMPAGAMAGQAIAEILWD